MHGMQHYKMKAAWYIFKKIEVENIIIKINSKFSAMKAGSIVICIDDTKWQVPVRVYNRLPEKNKQYVVRRLVPNISIAGGPDGVALVGIFGDWKKFKDHQGRKVFEEISFLMRRFVEILPPEAEMIEMEDYDMVEVVLKEIL